MGRIPIRITKIKVDNYHRALQSEVIETVSYLFTLEEKGQQWQKTFVCDRNDLLKLREELDKLIEETTTAEILQLTSDIFHEISFKLEYEFI